MLYTRDNLLHLTCLRVPRRGEIHNASHRGGEERKSCLVSSQSRPSYKAFELEGMKTPSPLHALEP